MKITCAVCQNCGAVLDAVGTYLDADGEPVRDTLRQCGWCGSYNLAFEEIQPDAVCDSCGAEDGFRDASICVCGQHLCPTCRAAHENYPHLCAGRFVPAFPNCSGTAHFGNPDPTEEEAR